MTPNDGMSKTPIPGWKWIVVVLMLFATVINYMDRQALASVGSYIKKDFSLGEEGYGTLEAWFGYSYAVFLIVAGFLAASVSDGSTRARSSSGPSPASRPASSGR